MGKKESSHSFSEKYWRKWFQAELQKWQMKNPRQAILLAMELQKALGIYEEVKNETNPEIIQQKSLQRLQEMDDKEQKKVLKKMMEIYQENAPAFLSSLEKKFPWHLRYYWLVIILIVFASSGISFLVGYLLEPTEKIKY